jgi:hypothetical protein
MELFEQFPPDIQTYILKENPRFREINQYYALHGKHLFEEKYCNDPISKHEFFSYIDSNKKPNFTIYAINDNACEIWQFVYNRGTYGLYKVIITKNNNILMFHHSYTQANNTYLHDIEDLYNMYKYIHYDIMTVNNIIKARKCTISQHSITYSIHYLDKMLSYAGNEVTADNFYNMSILNIYFSNKDIISGVLNKTYHINFSLMLSNPKLHELYVNILKKYKHNISTGYELQLQQLH